MRFHHLFLFALLVTTPAIRAQEISYLPQIGDGPIGEVGLRTEFIFVNSGGPTQVKIEFISALPNENGEPMVLDLGEVIGAVSVHEFPLGSGDSTSFATTGAGKPGDGSPQVGYAVVTAGGQEAGASDSGVGGTAVFIQTELESGIVINEAGVPLVRALSEFTLFVDTTGTRDTALAIVNTGSPFPAGGSTTPTVLLSLFDPIASGAALATSPVAIATSLVPIDPGKQANNFIAGYFDIEQVPQLKNFLAARGVNRSSEFRPS